jgi:hypothetical protein
VTYAALSYPDYMNGSVCVASKSVATKSVASRQKFQSTIELLSEGGDARIVLAGYPAVNKYGCPPFPDPSLIAFSSSTASVISEAAYAAADDLRNRLALAVDDLPEVIYSNELNRIKHELLSLCALDDLDDLNVVFGTSGTDLHLIAAQLSNKTMPTLAIMPDPMETGSGVSAALAANHFSSRSALCESVAEGAPVAQATPIDVASVAIRFADGSLRPESVVDAEVEAMVENAIKIGQQVLLILVDTSKTGLISPSPSCAIKLKLRHPHLVDVLVDACQFRISTFTLHAYLEYGFMVMVTGSKFLSGPTFSGALFIPGLLAKKLLSCPIASGLQAYSSRAEWPENCEAAKSLDNVANFGLLLRWQAALEELRQFMSVPNQQIAMFSQRFSNAIQNRLKQDESFSQIAIRPLDRSALVNNEHWDNVPTIFSFVLVRDGGSGARQVLSHQDMLKIYQCLQLDPMDPRRADINRSDTKSEVLRCQLGQPVIYGYDKGEPVSALRICLSARLIVEATINNGENADKVIQRALSVLNQVSACCRKLI